MLPFVFTNLLCFCRSIGTKYDPLLINISVLCGGAASFSAINYVPLSATCNLVSIWF